MMEDNVKTRLESFIRYKHLNKAEFQRRVGVSTSFVTNISKGIGAVPLQSISKEFPELNTEWLINGEGEMINKLTVKEGYIPVIPLSLVGATMDENLLQNEMCEQIFCPITHAKFAVRMSGNDMFPIVQDGAYVVCGNSENLESINWGKVYVLDTNNGILVKFLYPTSTDNLFRCVSAADTFPDFEIKKSDIQGCFRALMTMHNL